MNTSRSFSKIALLAGILFGALALSGSLAVANDPPQLEIVTVDSRVESGRLILTIEGQNFDNGAWPPDVTLGDHPLEVDESESDAIRIVASIDNSEIEDVFGDIPVTVETGSAIENSDVYCLTRLDTEELVPCLDEPTTYQHRYRQTTWRVPQGPNDSNLTGFSWKDGPAEAGDWDNPWGDPVFFQLLEDYNIDLRRWFEDYGDDLLLRCKNKSGNGEQTFDEIIRTLKELPDLDWDPQTDPRDGQEFLRLQSGTDSTILTIKKGYRWDGPSAELFGKRWYVKPASLMRASCVHDALYDLMRLELIPRDQSIGSDGWWNRKMTDCMLYMIVRQDGFAKYKARSNFTTVRVGGAKRVKNDVPDYLSHALADAGEDRVFDCAPPLGVEVTLDGSGSQFEGFIQDWSWELGGQVIGQDESVEDHLFGPGVHTATLTVDDGDDGDFADTDEVVITVIADAEAPVFDPVPDIENVPNDPGQCGATVHFEVTATDDCEPPEVICVPASGSWFDVGTTPVSCTATDVGENETTVDFTVEVEDREAPVVTGITSPLSMWPANHKYGTFTIGDFVTSVHDNCSDVTLGDARIRRVTSDEPEDVAGGGDGNTMQDIVVSFDGRSVQLRSERLGGGNGRVYTVYIEVADDFGNVATASFQVHVTHDQTGPALDDGPAYEVVYHPGPMVRRETDQREKKKKARPLARPGRSR
jgi:hypothetical protein